MNVASENVTNNTPQVKLPARIRDMTGQRFGRLIAIEFIGVKRSASGKSIQANWKCRCDCGVELNVPRQSLMTANTRSCGCLNRDAHTTHGMTNSPEFTAWQAMRDRCCREKNASYGDYGARGITVCDRWNNSFTDWLSDVGKRPTPLHTFGRKDNNGNYENGNCGWETGEEQGNNRRNNIRYEYHGESLTAPQWARKTGINLSTLVSRLKKQGLTIRQALETPIDLTKVAQKSGAALA